MVGSHPHAFHRAGRSPNRWRNGRRHKKNYGNLLVLVIWRNGELAFVPDGVFVLSKIFENELPGGGHSADPVLNTGAIPSLRFTFVLWVRFEAPFAVESPNDPPLRD